MGVYVWAMHMSELETFIPKWGGKAGSLPNTHLCWDIRKIEYHEDRLNLNIQNTKIMASSLITSWKIDGETMEAVTDFILLGSKITADGDCSKEIRRCLLLGRKAMTNLNSILKSRDVTLPTKIHLVKATVFPVVMYGCNSGTINKTECWRIDAFKLWRWRRLLRVPWTERRSNQSILKEINSDYSLEGLMLKLKLQYFGHLMWRTDSLEKTQILGKIEGRRRRGWQRMRWLDGIRVNGHDFEQALGDGEGQGSLACCSPWGCRELDTTKKLNNDNTRTRLWRERGEQESNQWPLILFGESMRLKKYNQIGTRDKRSQEPEFHRVSLDPAQERKPLGVISKSHC